MVNNLLLNTIYSMNNRRVQKKLPIISSFFKHKKIKLVSLNETSSFGENKRVH